MDEAGRRDGSEQTEKEARVKTSFVNESFDDFDLFGAPEASGGGGTKAGREGQSDLFSGIVGEDGGELNGDPFGGGARDEWEGPPTRGKTVESPRLEFFERQSSSGDEGEEAEATEGQCRASPSVPLAAAMVAAFILRHAHGDNLCNSPISTIRIRIVWMYMHAPSPPPHYG